MMRKSLLVGLWLVACCVVAAKENGNISSCRTEDGKATVYLKKSTPSDPKREIWLQQGKQRIAIWSGQRRPNMSIATNRAPIADFSVYWDKKLQKKLTDKELKQLAKKNSAKIARFDPDPYQHMSLVKAAYNGEVLVIIVKTQLKQKRLVRKKFVADTSYVGGFFFDQLSYDSNMSLNDYSCLPPHNDYTWHGLKHLDTGGFDNSYQVPWLKEHDGYEYFLRSFIKDKQGNWQVHVSAALSILWADSMSLPLQSLTIEDNNTYAATFRGKYQYYRIDANKKIKQLTKKYKITEGIVTLFDYYGGVEQLCYKGKRLSGKTVEKIRYIPPAGSEQQSSVSSDNYNSSYAEKEQSEEAIFQSVYTTLHGGKKWLRIAYDKSYWWKFNSWVGIDELSFEQVWRFPPPPKDGLGFSELKVDIAYGSLPRRLTPLEKDEIRQSYCLNIYQAKKQLRARIKKVRIKIQEIKKSTFKDKETIDYYNFKLAREQLYFRLLEEALQNNKAKQN